MTYPHSTYTTTRGLTYSCIRIPPQSPNTPYILFLHGFPSTSHDWRHQVSFFAEKGYGILAPDLLGFGETSKPSDLEMYRGEGMAQDIVEILALEGTGVVVGVAHDWGSFLLSRLANYHPERISAYAFIDHGYAAPGQSLTPEVIQHINSAVQAKLGFSILGYFLFFDEEDAATLLDKHSESVESLYFTNDDEINKTYKGAPGGLRAWLTEGKMADVPAYRTIEDRNHYQNAFSLEKGGYGPAINWYRASLRNINKDDEKKITTPAHTLTHPTLLIASTKYAITVAINYPEQMRPLVSDLRVENVTGGHWLQLEQADEVNKILEEFITEKRQI
ncbi:Epoxide hydrolase-like protein [Niveomyces insectorum RCEF 264]|uniref:Epoxide hydrolase-like protein n=1 Tax=Niveomyces insectorum RCEF 264 TaxID=1081102 RepID=A0A167WDI9_9HYPO|nr:Epoxide hydrolase-like protein [Niveomyces insectorum RCEF 264]